MVDREPRGGGREAAPKRTRRNRVDADDRLRALERLVFGARQEGEPSFGKELEGLDDDTEDDGDMDEEGDGRDAQAPGTREVGKPAWVDDDDEEGLVDLTAVARTKKLRRTEEEQMVPTATYAQRLREQFQQIHGPTTWAQVMERPDHDDEAAQDADVLERSTAPMVRVSKLNHKEIRVSRARDANSADRSDAVIQAIDFHPKGELFLTAGARICTRSGSLGMRAACCPPFHAPLPACRPGQDSPPLPHRWRG